MGGSGSFTIIGASGIGKRSAISRAITLITENRIIEADCPYTKLINNSGISICMVGTPESAVFFEQAMQLARRSLGLGMT